mmetsp:Transcript_30260/g.100230  ORF Transcript_30260/g.100230 Transcript_30260/m.100230 type:complete len:220 (+) Transcript_30260:226-885(+)
MEGVGSRAGKGARDLRMPVDLLHVALALVHKVQLRRQVTQVVTPARRRVGLGVVLERQIPERDLVVRAGDGDSRRLVWRPLDGGDWAAVPREERNRLPRANRTQVPDPEGAVVGARHNQVVDLLAPRDDVDVSAVLLVNCDRRRALAPHVPHADARVDAARHEDARLDGRPLHVLDRPHVTLVRRRVHRPPAAGRAAPRMDLARAVCRRERPRRDRRPV